MFKSTLLAASLLLCPVLANAQAASPAPTTWDVFGGMTVARSTATGTPTYDYGFHASLTQRPYPSHRWIGGTIEGSGIYSSKTTVPVAGTTLKSVTDLYTAMAGPVAEARVRGVRPYVHALFGAIVVQNSGTVNGQALGSTTDDYFGTAFGGGMDFTVAHHTAVRTQADWLRIWSQSASTNDRIRLSAGLVFSF